MIEEFELVGDNDAEVLLVLEDLEDLIQRRRLENGNPPKWRLRLGEARPSDDVVVCLVEMEL